MVLDHPTATAGRPGLVTKQAATANESEGVLMETRTLGDLTVSALGLGCMGMADVYAPSDERSGIRTIQRALDPGVTVLDTAEIYGPFTNEAFVGKAIAGRRDEVVLCTKFGFRLLSDGGMTDREPDGRPENVRRAIDGSLERLGVDHVDLYYQHRVDPAVPVEETVGALSELVEQGKIRHIGLSEASSETIRRAHGAHPLTAVQSEYSLWTRDVEEDVRPTLRELGIGLVAYSPLGRGFLTGAITSPDDLDEHDWRRGNPRFQGENLRRNLDLVGIVERLADDKGCTPAQLALAWVLAQDEHIVPIPGTTHVERLEENVGALDVDLTDDDLREIADAVPQGAGDRYDESMMRLVQT
jgi:aryl-alcohol dehydrogenase-like predicted oxidoreductase